jgi:hypothetical protein
VAALGDISVKVVAQPWEGEESLRIAVGTWPDICRAVPPLSDVQIIGIVTRAYAFIAG